MGALTPFAWNEESTVPTSFPGASSAGVLGGISDGTVRARTRVANIASAIRRLRAQGHKVGLVRLKWFRPFPTADIVKSLLRFKAIGVIDRDYSFGSPNYGGVLYHEVRSALYSQPKRPVVLSFIAGLGGREIDQNMATQIFEKTKQAAEKGSLDQGDTCTWIGVRE